MRFLSRFSKFFPKTYKNVNSIQEPKRKLVAIFSLASLFGFLAFLPVIITFDKLGSSPIITAMIVVGYALVIYVATIVTVIFSKLGIAADLFKDYSDWPIPIHLAIMIGSAAGVLVLAFAKVYAIFSIKSTYESGTK